MKKDKRLKLLPLQRKRIGRLETFKILTGKEGVERAHFFILVSIDNLWSFNEVVQTWSIHRPHEKIPTFREPSKNGTVCHNIDQEQI